MKRATIIFVHGISGSGKSTVAKELTTRFDQSVHIDQDTFYTRDKPLITYCNSQYFCFSHTENEKELYTSENWDTEQVIDFEALHNEIERLSRIYLYVIVSGFALRSRKLRIIADFSFVLHVNVSETSVDDKLALVQFVANARAKSKRFESIEKKNKDYWMVYHVVVPFYQETLKLIQPSVKVNVCTDDTCERMKLEDIVSKICSYIAHNL